MLIVGATSAIAHETAKCFAKDGAEFFLVGRSPEKLEDVGNDLKVRGAKRIETYVLDVTCLDRHQEMIQAAITRLDGLDMVLIAYGTLGDQQKCQRSVVETMKEFTTNCTSVISLLTILASYFEQQKRGCIVTVKPGLIDTPMTATIKKGLLAASAKNIGEGIYHAMKSRKDVVYLPWFWRPIMLVIRSIPEPVFKKLSM